MFRRIPDKEVAEFLDSIKEVKKVAVDTETWYNPQVKGVTRFIKDPRKKLHPNNAPFIISMSTAGNNGVVIEVNATTLPPLREFFAGVREWIMFNANYDMHMLYNVGIQPKGKIVDVMVLHQLVDEEDNVWGLDDIAKKYRNSDADAYANAVLEVRKQLAKVNDCAYHDIDYYQVYKARPDVMIPYAASDTRDTFWLYEYFLPQIYAEDLEKVFEVECAVTPIIFQIERNGFGISEENIRKAEQKLSKELDTVTQQLVDIAGKEFNPNSSNDIVQAFKDLGYTYTAKTEKGNYKTDKEAIKALTHHDSDAVSQFAKLILQYRRIDKLLNTFISELKAYNQNGSVHCSFWQSGARTGRMSSSNPNLQNIESKDKTIRGCFKPRDGFILVFLDYSQQEYRLLAHHANEENLIKAIDNGLDVHRATASLVFGKPYESITADERQRAKTINFAQH